MKKNPAKLAGREALNSKAFAGIIAIVAIVVIVYLLSGPAQPPPVENPVHISISPASKSVSVGDTVALDIMGSGAVELFGFQFNLNYNPAVLRFESMSDGPFFNNNGADTTFCVPPNTETSGLLKNYACTRIKERGVVKGVDGEGVLARVTFTAISSGTSQLTFSNVLLANTDVDPVPSTIASGQVTVG